jgi:hypothetical protein
VLDFSVLAVDRDLTHGQTRQVDRAHVKKLMADFEQNPPGIMSLTVWYHSGLHASLGWHPVTFRNLDS